MCSVQHLGHEDKDDKEEGSEVLVDTAVPVGGGGGVIHYTQCSDIVRGDSTGRGSTK